MFENKDEKSMQQQQEQDSKDKKPLKPGDIEGKIEIPDTRERRDGPGGN